MKYACKIQSDLFDLTMVYVSRQGVMITIICLLSTAMPAKKLYKTEAEKRAAKKANYSRYYEKYVSDINLFSS